LPLKKVDKITHKLTLKYQVNLAQALSKMKHSLVILILDAHKGILQLIRPRILKNIKNDIHFLSCGRFYNFKKLFPVYNEYKLWRNYFIECYLALISS